MADSIILDKDTARLVVESVASFFDVEGAEEGVKSNLSAALTPTGGEFTLAHYDAVRNAWLAAYKVKKGGASPDACNMAWSRAFEITGLKKPRAASKAAADKAEKRSEAAKAVEVEINSCAADPVKLAEKATKALAKGDAAAAALATKALTKVQKENASAAAKASKEAATKKREAIREALKNADDKMLDTVLGILAGELVATKKRTK